MNDATNDNRTLRTLKGLAGYLSFVSSVVGVIATIVKRTNEIYQRAQDAWPILGPLTFYVGIAAIMTFFFTFAIFRPIVHGVTRNPAVGRPPAWSSWRCSACWSWYSPSKKADTTRQIRSGPAPRSWEPSCY
jgi:hypothetical protein